MISSSSPDTNIEIYGPQCHSHGITGWGNPSRGVVFVGIAPAEAEMASGKPFQGPAGQLTNALLEASGWHRDWVYCTNLICWRTMDGFRNRDPNEEEFALCKDRLLGELKEMKPKLVVLLGATAAKYLLGVTSAGSVRGRPVWSQTIGAYVMVTYHPSAILQGSAGLIHDIVRDFSKIQDIVEWGPNQYHEAKYSVVQTAEEAQSILDALVPGALYSLDVETGSNLEDEINVFQDTLLCWSISNGQETRIFPGDLIKDLKWPTPERGIRWAFQNGLFDIQVIYRHSGTWLPIDEDTMLQSYSLDERGGQHGLGTLSSEYLGAPDYKEETAKTKNFSDLPKDVLYRRNATDSRNTHNLVSVLRTSQERDEVRGFYQELLVPAANVFAKMQYHGVPIHRPSLYQLAQEWLPRWLTIEEALTEAARADGWKKTNLNWNSHLQRAELFYDILGLRSFDGKRSTDAKHLAALAGEHPIVDKYAEWVHLDHAITNYIQPAQALMRSDGRLHPNPKQHGTDTGRRSYTKPPVQVQPKEETLGKDLGRVRRIFGCEDPSMCIIEADFKQGEVWVAYGVTKDPILYQDLTTPDRYKCDLHRALASTCYSLPPELISGLQRHNMKFVRFGVMYGRDEYSLKKGELKHLSIHEIRKLLNGHWERYTVYYEWWLKTRQAVRDGEELISVSGRKRRLRAITGDRHHALNQGVNFPIQSPLADCTLASMIELYEPLLEYNTHILFDVHDSLLFEAPRKHLRSVMKLIQEVMEKPRFGLPSIPVTMGYGTTWGEAKDILEEEEEAA